MPASGSIAMIDNTLQTCSSISAAVCGSCQASCLTALNTGAGKTTCCMAGFYGFTSRCLNFCQYAGVGTNGTSAYITRAHCNLYSVAMGAGECYCICLTTNMCTSGQATGSYAAHCIYCNGTCKYFCCIVNPTACATPSYSFCMRCGDYFNIYTCACACNTSCASSVGSCVCLSCVTPIVGSMMKGTTCTLTCIYTA